MTTCLYPHEDGAYVLGALSPAERAEYERHLSTCDGCRASVASLAVLPGLLGRLDAATVAATLSPPVTAPPTLLPRTLAVATSRRRAQRVRRRWLAIAASVLVLALATTAGLGMGLIGTPPGSSQVLLTAMQPLVEGVPMTAEIGLIKVDDGTDIEMACQYGNGYNQVWVLKLVVYPRTAGEGRRLGTWTAESDQNWSLRSHTALAPDQIGRIELQRTDGVPLFTWTPA